MHQLCCANSHVISALCLQAEAEKKRKDQFQMYTFIHLNELVLKNRRFAIDV